MTERVWALAGPRQLNADGLRLVGATTLALLEGGARLAVGCCTGADAAAVHAAVQVGFAQRLTIWCAFGECRRDAPARTPGTCRWSAPAMVACAAAAGAQVRAWAGGGAEVPLAARLARRTRAVAGAATAGALVWLPRQSQGTLLLARCAVARVPVLALPLGCGGEQLPPLDGTGHWAPATQTLLPGAWRWRAAQAALL